MTFQPVVTSYGNRPFRAPGCGVARPSAAPRRSRGDAGRFPQVGEALSLCTNSSKCGRKLLKHPLTANHAEAVDLSGRILIQGLVNAHLYTWQTALRSVGADWTLMET